MIERDASPELLMSPKEQELRDKLVRNFDSAELTRDERAPLRSEERRVGKECA